MNEKNFVKWYELQGYNVIKSNSSYWIELGFMFYQSIPFNLIISPSNEELEHIISETAAVGLRFSSPVDSSEGYISYHVLYEGNKYELNSLSKKARYDVKKALKVCKIEPINFDNLLYEGWRLRKQTLIRQNRRLSESYSKWKLMCLAAKVLDGFEAWGAKIGDELVASLLSFKLYDTCLILYQQSSTRHLHIGVNNALTFVFTHEILSRGNINKVFYGLHSLDAADSVDRFKIRMNYYPKIIKQRIYVNKRYSFLFKEKNLKIVSLINKLILKNTNLKKLQGLIYFYLEGKKPIDHQSWPSLLLDYYIKKKKEEA